MMKKSLIALFAAMIACSGCAKKKQAAEGELQAQGGSALPTVIEKVNSAISPKLKAAPTMLVAVLPAIPTEKVAGDIAKWTEVDPAGILRTVFFGRFSVLPFRDEHIRDVDQKLAQNGINNPSAIASASPAELGRILGADALVYIDVTKVENTTTGVHSWTEYAATVRMIESATGEELWRAELNQTTRGGLTSKSSQVVDFVEFERMNRNRPLAFRQVAEIWSQKVVEDFKEKSNEI